MTPKWLQNGATGGPKTIQGALRTDKRKLNMNSLIFGRPAGPKWSPKITPKSNKMDLDPLLLALKKNVISQNPFFTFFLHFGSLPTLEIKPKRYTVCKKRRSALSDKKLYFSETLAKKSHPEPPKNKTKHKKILQAPLWKTTRKNVSKKRFL